MIRNMGWLFVAVLSWVAGSTASAQSVCPASDRITIDGVNLLDNANYEVYFGNTAAFGISALVYRNGTCVGVKNVLKNGANLGSSLPTGVNNVCFGNGVDVVTLVGATFSSACGSTTINPLNYAGNRVTLYGNGGADRFFGGTGADTMYGSTGNDNIGGSMGDFDQLFGENDDDQLTGGSGTFTWSVGGIGNDWLQDTAGFQDTMDGGSGNDIFDPKCNIAIITCSSGTDTLWHPPHGGAEPAGCENITHAPGC